MYIRTHIYKHFYDILSVFLVFSCISLHITVIPYYSRQAILLISYLSFISIIFFFRLLVLSQLRTFFFIFLLTFFAIQIAKHSHPNLPSDSRGTASSQRLWHIALQHPSQAIRRVLPIPGNRDDKFRLIIRLGLPYTGLSQLEIYINNLLLGSTTFSLSDINLSDHDLYQIQVIIPSYFFYNSDRADIVAYQPTTDPNLRLQVITSHLGNFYGERSVFFGIDNLWLPGLPHPSTGQLRDASPVWWIEALN